jgi:hypothetical protein
MNKHRINSYSLSNFIGGEAKKVNGAPFTVVSKKTGKEFTFKVSQILFKGFSYLHFRVESEYLNFRYLGYYRKGKVWSKAGEVHTPAAEAISWIFRNLEKKNFSELDSLIEVYHLGSCLRCGKTLTDSESIRSGFGPVCINR